MVQVDSLGMSFEGSMVALKEFYVRLVGMAIAMRASGTDASNNLVKMSGWIATRLNQWVQALDNELRAPEPQE